MENHCKNCAFFEEPSLCKNRKHFGSISDERIEMCYRRGSYIPQELYNEYCNAEYNSVMKCLTVFCWILVILTIYMIIK